MSIFSFKKNTSDLNRFRAILGIVFDAGGGALIKKMKLSYLMPLRCRIHCLFDPPKPEDCLVQMQGEEQILSPEALLRVLEQLGPTFIKFGQVLSLRADLVGEAISAKLSKLQSDVTSFPYAEVRRIFVEEFKMPPEQLFRSFEKKPVAAASLAQVHRAYLQDGTEVAVKVQRPDIRNTIEQDIHILLFLANLVERYLPELRPYQPLRVIKEFAEWTMRELDFKAEGNNAERFRVAFKDNAFINIPTVYWELTTSKILTMEFIHGVKANDLSGIQKLDSDPQALARNGVGAVFQQFLIDGFFHADPHPGNFFAMEGDVLCLHDFGMVGYLTVEQRKELIGCLIAFEDKDIDRFLKHFMHLAIISETSDVSGFQKDASEILSELFFSPVHTSVAWVFFRLINRGARREIRFSADLALFGKAIITTESMGLTLYPKFDLNTEVKPFIERAFKEYLDPQKALHSLRVDMFDYLDFFKTLPERTQRLLQRIEAGDINIKIDTKELVGVKAEFDRQNDSRILGAAAIALFLVSATFVYIEGIRSVGGVRLSTVGSVIAIILLSWLIVRLIKTPKK